MNLLQSRILEFLIEQDGR
jgi:hypothetical protein